MENRTVKIISISIIAIVIGLVGIILFSLDKAEPINFSFNFKSTKTAQQTRFLMDTVVEIRATGVLADEAVEAAFEEFERVESLLSRYIATSDISRINLHAGEWTTVSEETLELIERALHFCQLTEGNFDITVGRLVSLWGFGTDQYRIPSPEEINRTLTSVDYSQVELDRDNLAVKIPADSILDLGGIAKGYAVDQATKVLREQQISSGLINAGGDITTIGVKPDGNQWRVGVQDPRNSTEILAAVPLEDMAIVTSGDYQRFFMADGTRYHHILNPHTGYPASELTSVTIIANNATVADVLSTAVFVLGAEAGLQLVEKLEQVEAIIVDQIGNVHFTSGLTETVQIFK